MFGFLVTCSVHFVTYFIIDLVINLTIHCHFNNVNQVNSKNEMRSRFITAFGAGKSCVRGALGCIDMSGSHWRVHPRVQPQTFVRAKFGTACSADKCLLTRINFAFVHFRVELQGLRGRETLVAMLATIIAAEAGVHAVVSQLGELLQALIALVHSHRCSRQAFLSYLRYYMR